MRHTRWSGGHRHDRRAHVLAVLGRTPDGAPAGSTDQFGSAERAWDDGVVWELAKNSDPDVSPLQRRILRAIAHATRWRAEYRTARDALSVAEGPLTSTRDQAQGKETAA